MRDNRPFDKSISLNDTIQGLAILIAKQIQKHPDCDHDDASELGGRDLRSWLSEIVYDKQLVSVINAIIGDDNFNPELFLDGLFVD